MSISRAAVRGFARAYWDVPCPDGQVAGINYTYYLRAARQALAKRGVTNGDTWRAVFLREPVDADGEGLYLVRPDDMSKAQSFHRRGDLSADAFQLIHADKGLLDCAHYVSSALGSAGISAATNSAPALHQTLYARADTQTFATRAEYATAQRIFDSKMLQDGDMIFYSLSGKIHHCALILSGTYISCHTRSRHPLNVDDRDWNLGAGTWTYTLLHFKTDDDPKATNTTLAALPGWWAMQYGARTAYYHFTADGRVQGSERRPASGKASAAGATGHGYWYERDGKILMFWSKSGIFNELVLNTRGDTLSGAASDGNPAVSGSKIV